MMKLRARPLTAMASSATACAYVERDMPCKDKPVGELRAHLYGRDPWPMCERHLQPGMHPPDLRDKLHRWDTAA